MSLSRNQSKSNAWDRVLRGDVAAYQDVVESHQSAVSAVAYAIVGDFPISQDIAQETFWVAWTKRDSLRDTGKLSSWLCGIARNLAKQWRKNHKNHKKISVAASGDLPFEPAAHTIDPLQQSIADEEKQVVWTALEQIPEQFREVLTLYYRQGQSIADVATSLDISNDAARQRLSRGRTMLKGRVSQLVEGVLTKTKPDKSFVTKVITGLAAASMPTKAGTAAASTLSVAKTVTGTSASLSVAKSIVATGAAAGVFGAGVGVNLDGGTIGGIIGGVLGTLGGLLGGYIGTWLPAQFAETETERQLHLQQGRRIFRLTIGFSVGTLLLSTAPVFLKLPALYFVILQIALMLVFFIFLFRHVFRLNRLQAELRKNVDAKSDPNQSRLANYGRKLGIKRIRKGRRYTSPVHWFGFPLIDIQFSDADFGGNRIDKKKPRRHAKGWIALGDKATGILFAYGGVARGLIAVGGFAIGAISCGGVCFGVVSLGGLALANWAFGGIAIGYHALAGIAVGWHSAVGGIALSWHCACGGMAAAWDYAVGGGAFADQANTPLAEQVLSNESLKPWAEKGMQHPAILPIGITIFVLLHAVFAVKVCYQSQSK